MLFPNPAVAQSVQPSDLNVGPYVDSVVYRVIPSQDQRVAAILAGTIEMDYSFSYSLKDFINSCSFIRSSIRLRIIHSISDFCKSLLLYSVV